MHTVVVDLLLTLLLTLLLATTGLTTEEVVILRLGLSCMPEGGRLSEQESEQARPLPLSW